MATDNPTPIQVEEWRSVAGYEGYYEVSSFGRIRSLDRYVSHTFGGMSFLRGRIMRPSMDGKGYMQARLSRNCTHATEFMHKLVLIAFCRHPSEREVVNHINFIRNDNRIQNLEWVSSRGNNLHTVWANRHNPRTGERNGCAKISAANVVEIRRRVAAGEFQRVVGADFGIKQAHVSEIVRRKSWKHVA